MKKLLYAAFAACALIVTGCKTMPTADKVTAVSKLVGATAGLVANTTSMDDDTRRAVATTVAYVATMVPGTNETFESVWLPAAKIRISLMESEGKLTESQGNLVIYAVELATNGLDYLVDVRYPQIRAYENLVSAAVDGFTDGFLAAFNSTTSIYTMEKGGQPVEYDASALEYLKSKQR